MSVAGVRVEAVPGLTPSPKAWPTKTRDFCRHPDNSSCVDLGFTEIG